MTFTPLYECVLISWAIFLQIPWNPCYSNTTYSSIRTVPNNETLLTWSLLGHPPVCSLSIVAIGRRAFCVAAAA